MKAFMLTALIISTSIPASAKLGEDVKKCWELYGEPVATQNVGEIVILSFKKDGLNIDAWFPKSGLCENLIFSKIPVLNETEIAELLKNNGNDTAWKKVKDTDLETLYFNEAQIACIHDKATGLLLFATKSGLERHMKGEVTKSAPGAKSPQELAPKPIPAQAATPATIPTEKRN